MNDKKNAIFSFFSGAGFLDLGFEKSGFEVVFANEISDAFIEGYVHSRKQLQIELPEFGITNHSIDDYLNAPLSEKLANEIASVRETEKTVGFIGGPPCPDFSVAGKNKGHSGENGKLTRSYVEIIKEQKPDWFLFENVKGLWRTKRHRAFFDEMRETLEDSGYLITTKLMNSIQFGAPQDRDRILMFGVFENETKFAPIENFNWDSAVSFPDRSAFDFPWPSTNEFGSVSSRPIVPEELTIAHWFEKNRVDDHPNARHRFVPRAALSKFQSIDEGDDGKKSFKRLHRFRYSPTAAYGNNEVHLHPYEARRISVAEALAIQSLPREFELPGSMTLSAMFKTIGNGVPFLMAKGIANSIATFLEE